MSNAILRVIKAKHGDALLLMNQDVNILIDGGPSGVYKRFLKPQLEALENSHLDLVLVSHIDADHIDGILGLTSDLINDKESHRDPLVTIDEFWHNSFLDNIVTKNKTSSKAASVASTMIELGNLVDSSLDSQLVLASVSQGRDLRLDIEKALKIDLNTSFKNQFVIQENQKKLWQRHDQNISIRVVGPTLTELDDLKEKWEKELPKILEKEGSAALAAATSLDESVSNLASIVATVTIGNKSILFTGDARSDMILEWLEQTGDLKPDGSIHFDVIKQPHHGSIRNVDKEFFNRVTADHYVVSGNGGHGNPDPAMFEMLFTERPKLNYLVHLTYSLEEIMSHRTFIKKGKSSRLEKVFSNKKRRDILRFPDKSLNQTFVDIEL